MATSYVKKYQPETVFADVAVAASTTINRGEAVSIESNALNDVDAATDDATTAGIALGRSPSTKTDPIPVARVVYHYDAQAVSGTYSMGDGLKYSAAGEWTADGGANTSIWVIDDSASARTRVKAYFNVFHVAKLFVADA